MSPFCVLLQLSCRLIQDQSTSGPPRHHRLGQEGLSLCLTHPSFCALSLSEAWPFSKFNPMPVVSLTDCLPQLLVTIQSAFLVVKHLCPQSIECTVGRDVHPEGECPEAIPDHSAPCLLCRSNTADTHLLRFPKLRLEPSSLQ